MSCPSNKTYMKKKYGQYFTTCKQLQEKVCEFIKNNPVSVLEPSVGRGDLVGAILQQHPDYQIEMYEIDPDIDFLPCVQQRRQSLTIGDFLTYSIGTKYSTIVGNPPYVKHTKGNLYLDFTRKCFELLEDDGELIFIVPSDFFKITRASRLLSDMMDKGTFTHIFHPHNEKLFEDANIDVIVYRYCKNSQLEKHVEYNEKLNFIVINDGMITFSPIMKQNQDGVLLRDYFDLYVGIVSGRDDVFRHKSFGNINVLNSNGQEEEFIYIDRFPTSNPLLNTYMEQHKDTLMSRKIRKFNNENWFEWGALRNIRHVEQNMGRDCIYVRTMTRKQEVAFVGKVQYFGGSLIMIVPKISCDLHKIVAFLNSHEFTHNFMFSNRFKIGHRQIANSIIDKHDIHMELRSTNRG